LEDDGLWLYKNILPVGVSNLAFVGSEVSTFNNILTQSVQAEWLAHMIRTSTDVSPGLMYEYVSMDKTWKRSWMPKTSSRASLIQLHMTKYHDVLLEDMGATLPKTSWWQWFLPHTARDF
jgi:dimethylaniline monooxygenase (N-oxide forming)